MVKKWNVIIVQRLNAGIFKFKHCLAGTREDSKSCASVSEEINFWW